MMFFPPARPRIIVVLPEVSPFLSSTCVVVGAEKKETALIKGGGGQILRDKPWMLRGRRVGKDNGREGEGLLNNHGVEFNKEPSTTTAT